MSFFGKATGRLIAITFTRVLESNGTPCVGWTWALCFLRNGGLSLLLLTVNEAALPWHEAHRFVIISLGEQSLVLGVRMV